MRWRNPWRFYIEYFLLKVMQPHSNTLATTNKQNVNMSSALVTAGCERAIWRMSSRWKLQEKTQTTFTVFLLSTHTRSCGRERLLQCCSRGPAGFDIVSRTPLILKHLQQHKSPRLLWTRAACRRHFYGVKHESGVWKHVDHSCPSVVIGWSLVSTICVRYKVPRNWHELLSGVSKVTKQHFPTLHL